MTETRGFYHRSFSQAVIPDGYKFPIGGGMIGGTSSPYKINVDFDNELFNAFFQKAKDHLEHHKGKNSETLNTIAPAISLHCKTALQAYTTAIERNRSHSNFNTYARNESFNKSDNTTQDLSKIFKEKNAMCAEFSLLAKRFLDSQGIKNKIFNGHFLSDFDEASINIPNAHTFLIIEDQGNEYIWDPTNPNIMSDGNPQFRLLTPVVPFNDLEEEMTQDALMVKCVDVITNKAKYYGVSDDGSLPREHFVLGPKSELSEKQEEHLEIT